MADVGRVLLLTLASCMILRGQFVEGARILGVFPIPSISHQLVYRGLMMELNRRGHQLVVITSDPVNDPGLADYNEISISSAYKTFQEKNNFSYTRHDKRSAYDVFETFVLTGQDLCETLLSQEMVQAMIDPSNRKEHFDLIFLEWIITPCTFAFSHRFSAPMIGVTSLPPTSVQYDSVGNPTNPSYIPEVIFPYTDKNRTFMQRVETTIFNIRVNHFVYTTFKRKQDALTKRYFGASTPYIGDLFTQVSMLFLTYLEGFHPPRPNVPAVVYINGLHIRPPKDLPQDIQQFLDSAPKGAIYFSLGTNVRSDQLTAEIRSIFLEAFAELPEYHVLWKWEMDNLPGQPSNVKIFKWMPQQDILRHPNIKVFITHGGQQSTEEAIHMKVPMIGIPFFADQEFNTKLGEDKGVTICLEVEGITKTSLLEALQKIIEDKSYRENIERLSALVNDQQNTPMERAVWWTEYVLRHKGAKHLRTAAVDMPWYTYLLLDIVLFFLAIILLFIVLLSITARFIFSKIKMYFFQKEKTN